MLTHSFFTKNNLAEALKIFLGGFFATSVLSRIYDYSLSFTVCLFLLSPADSLELHASNKESHCLHNNLLHTISPHIFPSFFPNSKFTCENNSVMFLQSWHVLS